MQRAAYLRMSGLDLSDRVEFTNALNLKKLNGLDPDHYNNGFIMRVAETKKGGVVSPEFAVSVQCYFEDPEMTELVFKILISGDTRKTSELLVQVSKSTMGVLVKNPTGLLKTLSNAFMVALNELKPRNGFNLNPTQFASITQSLTSAYRATFTPDHEAVGAY
jgi:hypothetical protein